MEEREKNIDEKKETWYCKDIPDITIVPYLENKKFNMQCRNNAYTMPVPPPIQDKLMYDQAKACIDVEKHRALKEQDLEYEERKNRNKMFTILGKEMVSYDIFCNSYGELFYVQIGPQEEKLRIKRLCNLNDYHCCIFQTYGKKSRKVLNVTWRGRADGVYFRIGINGISAKNFCRVFKAQGVCFQLSRRCEKEVLNALIAYSITNSKEIEIPERIGWNKMSDGRWHFAKPGEIVMEEVWGNGYE